MPKHTRQKKGRLEIRNIGLHEGGLYICQVIGKKLLYKGPSTMSPPWGEGGLQNDDI